MGIQVNLYCHQYKNSCKGKHLYNMPSAGNSAVPFWHARDVSRHSLITRSLSMKLRLPRVQGEPRLDMGAKFACSFARMPA